MSLPLSRDALFKAQKGDRSLAKYFSVVADGQKCGQKQQFSLEERLLMRRWVAHADTTGSGAGEEWSTVNQIVVPSECRQHILKLAHEHSWSSHLGVAKTYDRVLQHFFWPGLKEILPVTVNHAVPAK